MRSMWKTARPLIEADDAVGFYRRDARIWFVRWNKPHTQRYVQQAVPAGTPSRRIKLEYEGKAPLYTLTTADRLPLSKALRLFVESGPWNRCMFCGRSLSEPLTETLGVGIHCATKHLDVSRRFLEIVVRRNPPTGPGIPRSVPVREDVAMPAHRHLQLVAVNGRRVA